MDNKLFIILFSVLVLIITGIAVYQLVFSVDAQIIIRVTPELGQELVIYFNQPVDPVSAEKGFLLNPGTAGEFVWFNDNTEAHFIPFDELRPNAIYTVNLTNISGLSLTYLKQKIFSFYAPAPQPVLSVLDDSVDASSAATTTNKVQFTKSNGETVEINEPRITKGKYVDIDKTKMILTIFNNGVASTTYNLSAIGNPKIVPTPVGKFKVLNKERNHYVRSSKLWMPYSIHFYRDFFIHEIPYWTNGKRINSKYSGGCIRLSPGDSEAVYNSVEIGTPIIIY